MSVLQSIQNLLTANNNLFGKIRAKLIGLDNRLTTDEATVANLIANKNTFGITNARGTHRFGILQGVVYATGGTSGLGGTDDFANKVANLGTVGDVYMHIRLPLKTTRDSEMFWFKLTGYCYGTSRQFNETWAGYCYQPSNGLLSTHTTGVFTPSIYVDAANNVVLRLLIPNIYYSTMRVDTMRVGNGRLFSRGELVHAFSLSSTVNFG